MSYKAGGASGASVSGAGGVEVVGYGWAGSAGVTKVLGSCPGDGSWARIYEVVAYALGEVAAPSDDAAGGWAGAIKKF